MATSENRRKRQWFQWSPRPKLGRAGAITVHALLAAAASTPLITGCGGELPGEISDNVGTQHSPLYYLSTSLWGQKHIPVCWETAGDETEKRWVEEALRGQRSWSSQAGVSFVGWGDCTSRSTGIRITAGTRMQTDYLGQSGGTAHMQLDFSANPQGTWTRCIDNSLTREECITTVALHEFGHAIGLAHEQNRPDTPTSCTKRPQGTNGDKTFGSWDPVSIMNYCGGASELSGKDLVGAEFVFGGRYGDAPHAGDFNGDGRDDLMCHHVTDGRKWLSYANNVGSFHGTGWSQRSGWCSGDRALLHKGDFNGDGRSDLLCHDTGTGRGYVDYADTSGRFGATDRVTPSFCGNENERLLLGDFNGDGRTDLLCHDIVTGRSRLDYASWYGSFNGTDWTAPAWCAGQNARLHAGDFNGDGRDDLLCHNVDSGGKWIDYANSYGRFYGTNWGDGRSWCPLDSARLLIGDLNGDNRDDLLCHDAVNGRSYVDYADGSGHFNVTDWVSSANMCNRNGERPTLGDFNGDGRDDLLCHDVTDGGKAIAYTNTQGRFDRFGWSTTSSWCGGDAAQLH